MSQHKSRYLLELVFEKTQKAGDVSPTLIRVNHRLNWRTNLRKILMIGGLSLVLGAPRFVESTFALDSSLLGTWKLNLAKSKFDPGPPPKLQVRSYEAVGNGSVKLNVEGIDPSGNRYAFSATANFDGKDYLMTGTGIPNGGDSLSYTRIDAYTVGAEVKRAGKVVNKTRLVVSKDLKVLTITADGINQGGQATRETRVYDKQ